MKKIIYLIACIGAAWACQTRYAVHNFEVLKPALYTLPGEVETVLIVDHTRPFRGEAAVILRQGEETFPMDTIFNDEVPNILVRSLHEAIAGRNFFRRVDWDTASVRTLTDEPGQAFSAEEATRMCRAWNVDAILALDLVKYHALLDVTEPASSWYFTQLSSSVQSLWRFYRPSATRFGTFETRKDSLFWSGQGMTPVQSVAGFPSYLEAWEEVARLSALQMANWITPRWESESRKFTVWGNDYFEIAAALMSAGKWDEAEKNWGYVYANGTSTERARAASNIANSLEMKGLLDEALVWMNRAKAEFLSLTARRYREETQQTEEAILKMTARLAEIEKLNKQMGE